MFLYFFNENDLDTPLYECHVAEDHDWQPITAETGPEHVIQDAFVYKNTIFWKIDGCWCPQEVGKWEN